MTAETALAFFTRYLDESGWPYEREADACVLHSHYLGDDAEWKFNMFAQAKGDGVFLLGVNSFLPNRARPGRRAACQDILSRLNLELAIGCFEMDPNEGLIRFRTSVLLPGTDITVGVVKNLVESNWFVVDTHLARILSVLYAVTPPAEAPTPKSDQPAPRLALN